MMKKCYWQIWVSKSGKILRPKKQFSKKKNCPKIFFCKKINNLQIVTHPYFGRCSKTCWQSSTTIFLFLPSAISVFLLRTQNSTDFQWGYLGQHSWKISNLAFERLGKGWRNAVDQLEFQIQKKILGPKNYFPKFGFLTVKKLC